MSLHVCKPGDNHLHPVACHSALTRCLTPDSHCTCPTYQLDIDRGISHTAHVEQVSIGEWSAHEHEYSHASASWTAGTVRIVLVALQFRNSSS